MVLSRVVPFHLFFSAFISRVYIRNIGNGVGRHMGKVLVGAFGYNADDLLVLSHYTKW